MINLSITFDLQTGREIRFDELFANYDRDRKQILKVLFGKRMERTRATEDDCASDYDLNYLSDVVVYAFSRDGLIAEPRFGYVRAYCAERVIVPYPTLKPFARPDGLLARVTR